MPSGLWREKDNYDNKIKTRLQWSDCAGFFYAIYFGDIEINENILENTTVSYNLGEIPEYNGKIFVTINNNIPNFEESDFTRECFERYSKLDKLVWENEQKRVYLVKNVHTINQYTEGYPTGCESAALWVLLKHYGIDVNLDDIIDNLKKGEEPYYENGVRYGGNIYIEFVY